MLDNRDFINNFRIVIASLPDRKNCVCEIYYNHIQWAEISDENGCILVQFYPHPSQNYWEFPIDVVLEILEKAKKKFLEG